MGYVYKRTARGCSVHCDNVAINFVLEFQHFSYHCNNKCVQRHRTFPRRLASTWPHMVHGINVRYHNATTYMQNSRKLRSRNHKVSLSSNACIKLHSISFHTAQNSLEVFVRPSFVFCRRRDCRPLLTSALRSCSKGSETGK